MQHSAPSMQRRAPSMQRRAPSMQRSAPGMQRSAHSAAQHTQHRSTGEPLGGGAQHGLLIYISLLAPVGSSCFPLLAVTDYTWWQ